MKRTRRQMAQEALVDVQAFDRDPMQFCRDRGIHVENTLEALRQGGAFLIGWLGSKLERMAGPLS